MSFDQQKYIEQYKKENYDRILVLIPKGTKDVWKTYASAKGITMSECIRRAMDEYMEK